MSANGKHKREKLSLLADVKLGFNHEEAEFVLGSPQLLAEMVAAKWITPVIKRHKLYSSIVGNFLAPGLDSQWGGTSQAGAPTHVGGRKGRCRGESATGFSQGTFGPRQPRERGIGNRRDQPRNLLRNRAQQVFNNMESSGELTQPPHPKAALSRSDRVRQPWSQNLIDSWGRSRVWLFRRRRPSRYQNPGAGGGHSAAPPPGHRLLATAQS